MQRAHLPPQPAGFAQRSGLMAPGMHWPLQQSSPVVQRSPAWPRHTPPSNRVHSGATKQMRTPPLTTASHRPEQQSNWETHTSPSTRQAPGSSAQRLSGPPSAAVQLSPQQSSSRPQRSPAGKQSPGGKAAQTPPSQRLAQQSALLRQASPAGLHWGPAVQVRPASGGLGGGHASVQQAPANEHGPPTGHPGGGPSTAGKSADASRVASTGSASTMASFGPASRLTSFGPASGVGASAPASPGSLTSGPASRGVSTLIDALPQPERPHASRLAAASQGLPCARRRFVVEFTRSETQG